MSQTRLVATKTAAKPQKLAAAPKRASSPPPASIAKTSKARPSAPPVAAAPAADKNPAAQGKTELKARFAKLSSTTAQIGTLKRSLNKTFFDIGLLLNQIRNERLYEVKGYGSFESFVEREIDINKAICLKLTRVVEALNQEQALAAGVDRAVAAVAALDGEAEPSPMARPAGSPAGGVPLHKQ
jgi:hypothetical protein